MWASAHVLEERREAMQPAVTHGDATTSVLGIGRVAGLRTSPSDPAPALIFRRGGSSCTVALAVRPRAGREQLATEAAARSRTAISQPSGDHDRRLAAFAATQPRGATGRVRDRQELRDGEPSEDLTQQIETGLADTTRDLLLDRPFDPVHVARFIATRAIDPQQLVEGRRPPADVREEGRERVAPRGAPVALRLHHPPAVVLRRHGGPGLTVLAEAGATQLFGSASARLRHASSQGGGSDRDGGAAVAETAPARGSISSGGPGHERHGDQSPEALSGEVDRGPSVRFEGRASLVQAHPYTLVSFTRFQKEKRSW
jgi:hypothetical protein